MNGIKTASVKIEGVSPLLTHNARLVDPTDEWAIKIREITSKHHTKKTDEDQVELQRLEFFGGMYFDEKIGPYVPAVNIEGCIRDAAKSNRKGAAVTAGVQVEPDRVGLLYDGPRDMSSLYKDRNFVDSRTVRLQGKSSLIRTRPRFERWALEFEVMAFTDVINLSDIKSALVIGGRLKGICDFRPKFGRFILKKFDEI